MAILFSLAVLTFHGAVAFQEQKQDGFILLNDTKHIQQLPVLFDHERMRVINPTLAHINGSWWRFARLSIKSTSPTFEGELCPAWNQDGAYAPIPCTTAARLKEVSLIVQCKVSDTFQCM